VELESCVQVRVVRIDWIVGLPDQRGVAGGGLEYGPVLDLVAEP
jgi:hypothetical protein